MSKEDRYAHLGDGIEAATDGTADEAGATDDGQLRVTIEDGDEETVLAIDPDVASVADIREAVESASETGERGSERPFVSGDPGRLALELGTLGPRLALKSVESLVDGLQVEKRE